MKLIDTYNFNDPYTGIFYMLMLHTGIYGRYQFPWLNDEEIARQLDEYYYMGRSGEKRVNMLYERELKLSVGTTENPLVNIAAIIYNKFASNWKYIYDAMMSEYNAIENYSMVEKENVKNSSDVTNKASSNITTTSGNKNYGFNSISGANSSATEQTTVGDMDGNQSNSVASSSGDKTLTRSGNIGVTTTQQMITQELELRKNNFFEIIYKDVDSILTLPLY